MEETQNFISGFSSDRTHNEKMQFFCIPCIRFRLVLPLWRVSWEYLPHHLHYAGPGSIQWLYTWAECRTPARSHHLHLTRRKHREKHVMEEMERERERDRKPIKREILSRGPLVSNPLNLCYIWYEITQDWTDTQYCCSLKVLLKRCFPFPSLHSAHLIDWFY